ncbi:MAG TPA: hypothetical protein VM287_07230 [Egibacteraceae bacterium]|nr:hypothetical protein [Egibacteraceae bacterium]
MSERTRATPEQAVTDIDKEPGDWVESAKDPNADLEGDTGSRPEGDQITHEMAETTPEKADRQPEDRGDFAAPTGGEESPA